MARWSLPQPGVRSDDDRQMLTILFDGKLYLATIKEDSTVELSEKNHIIYYYNEARYPGYRHYNIDVVTKGYFLDYLDVLNKDRKLLSGFYRQEISKGGKR